MRTTDARPHSLPIRKMKVAASFGSSPGQRDGDCAGPVACRLASRAWTVMCRRHVGVTARERLTGQSGNVRCFHGVLEKRHCRRRARPHKDARGDQENCVRVRGRETAVISELRGGDPCTAVQVGLFFQETPYSAPRECALLHAK